jgi:hypothetical protein
MKMRESRRKTRPGAFCSERSCLRDDADDWHSIIHINDSSALDAAQKQEDQDDHQH